MSQVNEDGQLIREPRKKYKYGPTGYWTYDEVLMLRTMADEFYGRNDPIEDCVATDLELWPNDEKLLRQGSEIQNRLIGIVRLFNEDGYTVSHAFLAIMTTINMHGMRQNSEYGMNFQGRSEMYRLYRLSCKTWWVYNCAKILIK